MNRLKEPVQLRQLTTEEEKLVRVSIDPSINDCEVATRESVTRDGRVILFELAAALPADQGGYDLQVKQVDDISFANIHKQSDRYISRRLDHKDNTKELKGVINMSPFQIFANETRLAATDLISIKLVLSAIYGVVASWLRIPVINQIGMFTIIAFFDAIIGLVPNVHPKDQARTSTALSRFWQWVVSLCAVGALQAIQLLNEGAYPTGIFGRIAEYLPNYGIGLLEVIYGFRIIGSIYKAFYGERAPKIRKKLAKHAPKWLRPFLKDDDIFAR
jgi:hypothetical protein